MSSIELLKTMLSPQGIVTVTTGGDEVGRFLQSRWGSTDPEAVRTAWLSNLERARDADIVIIGVPCDVGAGFERGSFKGPLGIRTALLHEGLYEIFDAVGIADLGDIRVNPHLLDDSYYRPGLLQSVRASRGLESGAPVSPLSALRAIIDAVRALNPAAKFLILGGDHSLSRVPVEALVGDGSPAGDLGVLHFDAHTDLLETRDGVPYNFATWAYYANDAIGRGGRMVQVGVRVSGRAREAWESEMKLRQIRMDEITGREFADVAAEVVTCFERAGVARIYVSNDIDATDPTFAASTGTMEMGGLHPDLICAVLSAVSERFEVVACDVVEVAPPLKWHIPGEPARTIRTACRYVLHQLQAMGAPDLGDAFDAVTPATEADVLGFPGFV